MRALKSLSLFAVPSLVAIGWHVQTAEATPSYTCNKKVKPTKAQVGTRGQYEVKDGLNVKKFYGFLNRKKTKAKNGCFFGGLRSGQCVTMQFPIKGFEAGSVRGQCVVVDSGKKFNRARPTRRGPFKGSDMLTKCPNKTGYKCDRGYNSDRAKKYAKALEKKGKILYSYCAPKASYNRDKFLNKQIFCQLYDRKSGTVFFATEFTYTM